MNDLAGRALNAVVSGLVAGVITALAVWLLSVLLPGVSLDPGFWGVVVGVLVGLITFVSGRTRNW